MLVLVLLLLMCPPGFGEILACNGYGFIWRLLCLLVATAAAAVAAAAAATVTWLLLLLVVVLLLWPPGIGDNLACNGYGF